MYLFCFFIFPKNPECFNVYLYPFTCKIMFFKGGGGKCATWQSGARVKCGASTRAWLPPGLFTFLHVATLLPAGRPVSVCSAPANQPRPPTFPKSPEPSSAVCCSSVMAKYRFCKATHVEVFANGNMSPPPTHRRWNSRPQPDTHSSSVPFHCLKHMLPPILSHMKYLRI